MLVSRGALHACCQWKMFKCDGFDVLFRHCYERSRLSDTIWCAPRRCAYDVPSVVGKCNAYRHGLASALSTALFARAPSQVTGLMDIPPESDRGPCGAHNSSTVRGYRAHSSLAPNCKIRSTSTPAPLPHAPLGADACTHRCSWIISCAPQIPWTASTQRSTISVTTDVQKVRVCACRNREPKRTKMALFPRLSPLPQLL